MNRSGINLVATTAGLLLLFASLTLSNITLASGHYQNVLRLAFVCCTIATTCFVVPLVRGPKLWRLAAMVLMLGILFEISDLLSRKF